VAGLKLDHEILYTEDMLLNTLSRNADWVMGWTVWGSNPDTDYRLFFSLKHPEYWGPQNVA
jgi:hypothetical protein